MKNSTTTSYITFLYFHLVVCACLFSFACSDVDNLESNDTSDEKRTVFNSGDTCASGCIWSSYAVRVGAQYNEAKCQDGSCACVVDGDIYSSCQVSSDLNDAVSGSRCARGCVWSTYAVDIGAQTKTANCDGVACACVVDGDVYNSCQPDADSNSSTTSNQTEMSNDLPDVPYFYQYDNRLYPSASCQNTSVAMVLAYLGWSGYPDDITASYGKNYAQSPAGLADLFNIYASRSNLSMRITPNTNGSFAGLKAELDRGHPVIVHGYFTSYGHVLVVLGYDANGYYVHDPAGKWSGYFKGGYGGGGSGRDLYYPKAAFEQAVGTSNGYNALPLWYHALR